MKLLYSCRAGMDRRSCRGGMDRHSCRDGGAGLAQGRAEPHWQQLHGSELQGFSFCSPGPSLSRLWPQSALQASPDVAADPAMGFLQSLWGSLGFSGVRNLSMEGGQAGPCQPGLCCCTPAGISPWKGCSGLGRGSQGGLESPIPGGLQGIPGCGTPGIVLFPHLFQPQ